MPRKLKVYRTAAGFHDAYVAAPSRKAALEAWGTDKDLFARGAAEEVTDPALTAAPLANPGEVVRIARGGTAENLAALGKPTRRTRRPDRGESAGPEPRSARPPPPRPSRAALDKAERALEKARAKQTAERERLARRKAELEREEQRLLATQLTELEALESALGEAEAGYDAAMREWRELL